MCEPSRDVVPSARDTHYLSVKIGNTIGAALDFREIHYGFGRHRYFLSDHQYQQIAKLGYVNWMQTFFTLMISKISICLLLLRIIVDKKFVRPIQGMIVFLVLSNLIITLIWIFQCIPVAGVWDQTVKERGRGLSKGEFERLIISQARKFSSHINRHVQSNISHQSSR